MSNRLLEHSRSIESRRQRTPAPYGSIRRRPASPRLLAGDDVGRHSGVWASKPWPKVKSSRSYPEWAGWMAQLIGWREAADISVSEALERLEGEWRAAFDDGRRLADDEWADLLAGLGLAEKPLPRGTVRAWDDLVRGHGAVLARFTTAVGDSEATGGLVVGLRGDGTTKGTRVLWLDATTGRGRATPLGDFNRAMRPREEGAFPSVIVWPVRARLGRSMSRFVRATSTSTPAPTASRTVSDKGIAFVARQERFSGKPYNEFGRNCTIGYGHLIHHGPCDGSEPEAFKRGIDEAQAEELLREDLEIASRVVGRLVTIPLNQAQFDSLVSFVYTIGTDAFAKSLLLEQLNGNRLDDVPSQLARAVTFNGQHNANLAERRAREAALFVAGEYA